MAFPRREAQRKAPSPAINHLERRQGSDQIRSLPCSIGLAQ